MVAAQWPPQTHPLSLLLGALARLHALPNALLHLLGSGADELRRLLKRRHSQSAAKGNSREESDGDNGDEGELHG